MADEPGVCPSCRGPMAAGTLSGSGALWWTGDGERRERLATGLLHPPEIRGRRCRVCGLIVMTTV